MIGKPISTMKTDTDKDVQWWFYQLDRGIACLDKDRRRWKYNEDWEDLKQWEGEDESDELISGDGDDVTINKLGSHIRTKRAAIAFKNPVAKMTPKTKEGWKPILVPMTGPDGMPAIGPDGQLVGKPVQPFKLTETVFNNLISEPSFGLSSTIDRLVKSGEIGYGVLKSGYRPVFGTLPAGETKDTKVQINKFKLALDGLKKFVRNPVDGSVVEDEDGNPIRKDYMPVGGTFFIDWQHYRNVIPDPDGGSDYMKHRWVAIEEAVLLEDMKKDRNLKNTKHLQGSGEKLEDEFDDRSEMECNKWTENPHIKEKTDMVRKFTIFDFVNNEIIVLADGHGKFLRKDKTPEGINHGPLSFYRLNEIMGRRERFVPRPPASDLIPLGAEYNQARKFLRIAQRHSPRKALIEEGALDAENIAKFSSDVDMEVIQADQVSQYGLDKTIHMITAPNVNPAIYSNISQIEANWDEISGLGESARGGSTGDTATEVEEIGKYSGSRLEFDRKKLAECLIDAFYKLLASMKENMTEEMAVQIAGEDGKMWTAIVDKSMLDFECTIDIDVREMAPVNTALQNAQKVQLMQVMGQAPWAFQDETLVRGWVESADIADENFIQALAKAAQEQVQMMKMAAQAAAQTKVPNAPPAKNTAQAVSQTGAGAQAPKMQGAS